VSGALVHSPAGVVRVWARLATAALWRERDALNQVNVFPVADADTGTNMHLTVREGARAVATADLEASADELMRRFARGALLGARGNSGVIISEWLRGLALGASDGLPFAPALQLAAESARAAVANPADGTILTAAAEAAAASAIAATQPGATADEVIAAAVEGASAAAQSSVGEMALLAKTGVLDAGACGLVLMLEALRVASHYDRIRAGSAEPILHAELGAALRLPASAATPGKADLADAAVALGFNMSGHTPAAGWNFADDALSTAFAAAHTSQDDEVEAMFVLRAVTGEGTDDDVAESLKADLAEVGVSVVVVGGRSLGDEAAWQAHVHSDNLTAVANVARRWAKTYEVEALHVRHLAAPADDLHIVAVTTNVTLAAELARAGAVVLLPVAQGEVGPGELAAAALESAQHTSLVLCPDPDAVYEAVGGLVDVYESDDDLDGETEVIALAVSTDLHAVSAVSALAATTGDPAVDRIADVRFALDELIVIETSEDAACEALRTADPDPGSVVTTLADNEVNQQTLDTLADVAADLSTELVLLRSGLPGTKLLLGIEAG